MRDPIEQNIRTYRLLKINIQPLQYRSDMAEADIGIYIATAGALAITIAILFAERAYRYRRLKEKKHAGTMGFEYESAAGTE
jgi:hypothetical protein